MANIFSVKFRGPPNEDIVRGFPGILATWPRLEGSIEVRSLDQSILQVSLITIALYRTDVIHPPSNKPGISGPKKDQSFLIGEQTNLFQVSAGKRFEEVLALDLPFLIVLPTNRPLPASISLGKNGNTVETKYQLFVSIVYGKSQTTYHVSYPIRIKCYDTLSTFGAFKVPIVNRMASSDHLMEFEYSIPVSSFGPNDTVLSYVKITPNMDWQIKSKKVKLQRVTMQIVECVTYNHEGDEPIERRRQICKTSNQLNIKLPDNGYRCEMMLDFPCMDLTDRDGLIAKQRPDIPMWAKNGFTTCSALYKVEYLLILKARFTHCKDIEIEQPITVTQFDHATCMSFMRSISENVEWANRVSRKIQPSAKVYKPNDSNSLWYFGYSAGSGGNNLKNLLLVR